MLSRSCRPSGHAVSRKRSGWSLAPSSQSAQRRLIPTRRRGGAPVRSRCHRSARTLGTWLACRWWRRDGKAPAGRVRRCCSEAAAPPGTPFLGNDPRGASRLPPIRDATTGRLTTAHDWRRHGSRSQAGGILVGATVAVSWLPYGEAPAGGWVAVVAKLASIRPLPLLGRIPLGDAHVPSDSRRDDSVTGGPRATDRDAIPGEVSSGSGMMTAAARHRSEAPIYS